MFMGRAIDNSTLLPDWLKKSMKKSLGIDLVERAIEMKNKGSRKPAKGGVVPGDQTRQKLLNDVKQRLGDLYPLDPNLQQLGSEKNMTNEQLKERIKQLDIELEGPKKIPDPQTVPPTIEQEQFFKNQLREFIKPQSNINTSINNQSVTYVAPVSPSVKHLTQQGIGG